LKKARYLSIEEKLALLRRIEVGERLVAVAKETGVLRKSLYEWRAAFRAHGAGGLNRKRGPKPGGRGGGGGGGGAGARGPGQPPPDPNCNDLAHVCLPGTSGAMKPLKRTSWVHLY
jgi:hypothetical protein